MASPAFWDDNRRAQELIRERAELARVVARVTELGGQASDLGILLELAAEAGDGSGDAELREGIAKLQRELDEFELNLILFRPHEVQAAIHSIHSGSGCTQLH